MKTKIEKEQRTLMIPISRHYRCDAADFETFISVTHRRNFKCNNDRVSIETMNNANAFYKKIRKLFVEKY